MDTEDLYHMEPPARPALRVAWPFFFSTGLFWRSFKRTWPKTHRDVTRGDMISIFGADLKASNDIMARHLSASLSQTEAGH